MIREEARRVAQDHTRVHALRADEDLVYGFVPEASLAGSTCRICASERASGRQWACSSGSVQPEETG